MNTALLNLRQDCANGARALSDRGCTRWNSLLLVFLCVGLSAASALGQTNISEPVAAVADNPHVDKTWLRETLQPLLAALVIFMMLALGGRFMHSTGGKGDPILLSRGKQTRARLASITRGLGSDFWVVAAIVGLLVAMRFHAVLFLSLLMVYAALKIVYLLLRERAVFRELALEEQARNDAEQEQHNEIDGFAEVLSHRWERKREKKKTPSAVPVRVEVRARPTLQSERFLSACIHENCFFCSLPSARRAPLAAELLRKLQIRWKEFEVSDDALYLNRQDGSGGLDKVCVLALHHTPEQVRGLHINAGFLQWALGNMLSKNDLVYETDDGYHAPDETERSQIALLPETRRPNLLPVKDIVNPWHAMIGSAPTAQRQAPGKPESRTRHRKMLFFGPADV